MNVRHVLPPDAIPSVDDPSFDDDYFGDPDDEVVVLQVGEETRAYPVRILDYHEIVNDVIAGEPVAVTWCPLCGSAIAYRRRVDGRVLTFGVSGKLADDDLVMYDRETGSEWKQTLGEAIAGPLEGTELELLPAPLMPYRRYREVHGGPVLARPGGASEAASADDEPAPIDYEAGVYDDYVGGEGFGLDAHRDGEGRSWDREDLDPKDVVVGLAFDGDALGVPLSRLHEEGGVVRATVGDRDVVVLAGDGVHAYADPGVSLEATDDPGRYVGDGTTWHAATGEAADGRRLERLPARRLYAFAWQDDHGADAFYG